MAPVLLWRAEEETEVVRRELGYYPQGPNRTSFIVLAVVVSFVVVAGTLTYAYRKRKQSRREAVRQSVATGSSSADETEKSSTGFFGPKAKVQPYSAWKHDQSQARKEEVVEGGILGVRDETWERNTCVFCLEDINDDDLVRGGFGCSHVFHDTCAGQWRQTGRQRCPLCRTIYVNQPEAS